MTPQVLAQIQPSEWQAAARFSESYVYKGAALRKRAVCCPLVRLSGNEVIVCTVDLAADVDGRRSQSMPHRQPTTSGR